MAQSPLDYETPKPSNRNTWWKVLLRIIVGAVAAIAPLVVGGYVLTLTHSFILAVVPYALMLIAVVLLSIQFRRFGYATGMLLTPILLGFILVIVLVLIWRDCAAHPI